MDYVNAVINISIARICYKRGSSTDRTIDVQSMKNAISGIRIALDKLLVLRELKVHERARAVYRINEQIARLQVAARPSDRCRRGDFTVTACTASKISILSRCNREYAL